MDREERYSISLLGEFTDKSLEGEFLAENLDAAKRSTAYIALVFGVVLGFFLVNSALTEWGTERLVRITCIRLVFIIVSALVFLIARRITKHQHLVYVITFYQAMMAVTYMLTLKYYESLNYFSILALLVITMAMYLLPNRITPTQLVSVAFNILFFMDPVRKMAGMQAHELYKIIAYQAILLIYCNINYCWTEATKRKKFRANRELVELSIKDPLTGVYNRKKFDDTVDQWICLSRRYGYPFSLILFDIDNFKAVNDTYGHIVGDRVLKEVAVLIKQSIREPDVFARWGGDEFAILLPQTDLPQARSLAERLKEQIAENNPLRKPTEITCSFGVTQFEDTDTKYSLLSRVDDLLLAAKTGGKNRIVS